MPFAEIAGRTRQEAAKLIDRVTANNSIDAEALLHVQAPLLADRVGALQILREAAPCRFFAGTEHPGWIAQLLPEHRRAVLKSAESSTQNRFNLLGYRTLWFGDPIDWQLDPVWSRRTLRQHWTTLKPLDVELVGDCKIVWELNRHQWLVQIAQAYAMTGDEQYAERCISTVESWIDANPYGIGINWSSSLEVAYRIMSWSWILLLLRNSTALSGNRLQAVLSCLWQHANHVARYPSHYFSPNTHLTGEALGLFYAGTLFPEFKDARRWREAGARVLITESTSQICGDGVHFERSTCYHRYTVETYEHFLLLAGRNGVQVPHEVSDRLRRMLDYVVSVRRPDGVLPEIGDADGGRLLPVVERDQCDPRGVLAVASAMFQRADFAWASQGLAAEVAWLMGEQGVRAFVAVPPAKPVGGPSRLFPSGGYVVMQTGWERDAHQMVVDVGPLGCTFSCGHGHADLLSVQCSAFGDPVLVDAGTYCYTSEPEWRNFFRGTAAHSTLMIDGCDQVQADGPFSWHARARVCVREWRSNGVSDFVDASHTAYAGLVHRRRVLFVKPNYWVVVDDVNENGEKGVGCNFPKREVGHGSPRYPGKFAPDPFSHVFDLGFQFAAMPVTAGDDRWVRADTPGGNTFWVGTYAPSLNGAVRPTVRTGDLAPIRGWVSTGYGQRTPAPLLVYSCRSTLPWRSITLLIPRRGTSPAAPAVSPLFDDHNLPIALELEDLGESIFVDDSDLFRSLDH